MRVFECSLLLLFAFLIIKTVVSTDNKVQGEQNVNRSINHEKNSDGGKREESLDEGRRENGDLQNGSPRRGRNAIAFLFGLSVVSLVFFVSLYICPPLCRQETKTLHRRYIDTHLSIGEVTK